MSDPLSPPSPSEISDYNTRVAALADHMLEGLDLIFPYQDPGEVEEGEPVEESDVVTHAQWTAYGRRLEVAGVTHATEPARVLYLYFLSAVLADPKRYIFRVRGSWDYTMGLLPEGAQVLGGVRTLPEGQGPRRRGGSYAVYAQDPLKGLWYYIGPTPPDGEWMILVAAMSYPFGKRIAEQIQSRLPEPPAPRADPRVLFRVWHYGSTGARRRARRLDVPSWEESRRNYSATTRQALDRLMKVSVPSDGGRLVLWHGAPGTGKTTALRALAREWQPWCEMHYVTDPEVLFAAPEYLYDVMHNDDYGGEDRAWRLIIAEDSDEFLRANARQQSGAALGRLLNVTDGLLGQGTRTLVLLTTNEPLGRLHPAVIRPGRCLAEIAFETFSVEEANQWLGNIQKRVDVPTTLAELFELTRSSQRISAEVAAPDQGLYL